MKLLFTFMLFLFLGTAYAQEVMAVAAVVAGAPLEPSIPALRAVLDFLRDIPTVGPYIKIGVEIIASITVFCTSAVLFIKSVLSIAIVSTQKWAPTIASSIKTFENKILPWFKYLSMMNTTKEEMKKGALPKVML